MIHIREDDRKDRKLICDVHRDVQRACLTSCTLITAPKWTRIASISI